MTEFDTLQLDEVKELYEKITDILKSHGETRNEIRIITFTKGDYTFYPLT